MTPEMKRLIDEVIVPALVNRLLTKAEPSTPNPSAGKAA